MHLDVNKTVILKVLDRWHGEKNERWVYSNDPSFKNLNDFMNWVIQHQNSLDGVVPVTTNEIDYTGDILLGFLHRHPKMEHDLNIPSGHVIVDEEDWKRARMDDIKAPFI